MDPLLSCVVSGPYDEQCYKGVLGYATSFKAYLLYLHMKNRRCLFVCNIKNNKKLINISCGIFPEMTKRNFQLYLKEKKSCWISKWWYMKIHKSLDVISVVWKICMVSKDKRKRKCFQMLSAEIELNHKHMTNLCFKKVLKCFSNCSKSSQRVKCEAQEK